MIGYHTRGEDKNVIPTSTKISTWCLVPVMPGEIHDKLKHLAAVYLWKTFHEPLNKDLHYEPYSTTYVQF